MPPCSRSRKYLASPSPRSPPAARPPP
jgi:hypothetical protein